MHRYCVLIVYFVATAVVAQEEVPDVDDLSEMQEAPIDKVINSGPTMGDGSGDAPQKPGSLDWFQTSLSGVASFDTVDPSKKPTGTTPMPPSDLKAPGGESSAGNGGGPYLWLQGNWDSKFDLFYQSYHIQAVGWVTLGPNKKGPQQVVDKLTVGWSSVCHTDRRSWNNVSSKGIRREYKHHGLPGYLVCPPQDLCFKACAEFRGMTLCREAGACPVAASQESPFERQQQDNGVGRIKAGEDPLAR